MEAHLAPWFQIVYDELDIGEGLKEIRRSVGGEGRHGGCRRDTATSITGRQCRILQCEL